MEQAGVLSADKGDLRVVWICSRALSRSGRSETPEDVEEGRAEKGSERKGREFNDELDSEGRSPFLLRSFAPKEKSRSSPAVAC